VPKKSNNRSPFPALESIESRVMLSSSPKLVMGPALKQSTPATAVIAPGAHAAKSSVRAAVRPTVRTAIPTVAVSPAATGLTGAYFRGVKFKFPVVTRTDGNINFVWGNGAPDPALVGHAFSVRWNGQITPQFSEKYTFTTLSDDGVRLWIGGQLVIGDWSDHTVTADRGSIVLQAGQAYDFRLDYFENGDPPAVIRLSWASPSQSKQVVPPSAFTTIGTVDLAASPPPAPAPVPAPPAPTPPDAPTNLAASAVSQTQIRLNWSDVAAESGFVVERSADGSTGWATIATIAAGQTQFDDIGLTASTAYFYRVHATSDAGVSTPSNVATATTATPPPPAPRIVYGLTNGGNIEKINTATASTTEIGTLLFGTAAADRDPTSGKFYYVEQNTSTPQVAVWDPATKTNSLIARISLSESVLRAAFRADGTLFITAGNGDLYTINTITGAPTLVGTITSGGSQLATSTGDMAFTADGRLYLDTEGKLYSVNTVTLNASYLGTTGTVGKVQIAFGSDGLLYGTVSTGDLYLIDLTTGAAKLIGDTGVFDIGDLASAAA
jgi:hypothetical protein